MNIVLLCVEMVDIGAYKSCKHFCKYCYANYGEKQVLNNLKESDIIKIRK